MNSICCLKYIIFNSIGPKMRFFDWKHKCQHSMCWCDLLCDDNFFYFFFILSKDQHRWTFSSFMSKIWSRNLTKKNESLKKLWRYLTLLHNSLPLRSYVQVKIKLCVISIVYKWFEKLYNIFSIHPSIHPSSCLH